MDSALFAGMTKGKRDFSISVEMTRINQFEQKTALPLS